MKTRLGRYPLFLFLLPIYFSAHGALTNWGVPLAAESAFLAAKYIVASLALTGIFWFYFRSFRKASLIALLLIAFNCFFGYFYESLIVVAGKNFLTSYKFILAFFFFSLLALSFLLKKQKRKFTRLFLYLNSLFPLLLLLELLINIPVIGKTAGIKADQSKIDFTILPNISKPDFYIIVMDEYAGDRELQDIFSYDNSTFIKELENQGFYHISNSSSNYPMTEYSMASFFNLNYLKGIRDTIRNLRDQLYCRELINNNQTINFFKKASYKIYNLSFFNFNDNKGINNSFSRSKLEALTFHTFLSKAKRDLGHNFWSNNDLTQLLRSYHDYNQMIETELRQNVSKPDTSPKLVYAHFNMPHFPYYYDSIGIMSPQEKWYEDYKLDKKGYIQYLKYTNRKMLDIIENILQKSPRPPIILLMSDHGFRQFNDTINKPYYFNNTINILLPSHHYESFYQGMSNVNVLRMILSSEYGQNLKMLNDSTSFVWEN